MSGSNRSSEFTLQADKASGQYPEKNYAPFLMKPWGPKLGQRFVQRLKRWWWLDFLIFAASTLLITLPIIYVGFPKWSQDNVNATNTTVQGISLSGPTPDTFFISINSTQRPNSIFTPTLSPFNVSFYLTDYNMETPFTTVLFPKTHVESPTLVNITDQMITITDPELWEQYLQVAFASETYRITNTGHTNLKLGALPTTNVNYNKTIEIPGFNGLQDISTTNLTVSVIGKDPFNLFGTANIYNPSTSTVAVGNLTYATYLEPSGTYIGHTYLEDVTLSPGNNSYTLKAATSQAPVLEALSVQPACETGVLNVTIVPQSASYDGVDIPWILPALANITQSLPIGAAVEEATKGVYKPRCM